jgi:hypothetical protein
VRGYLRQQRGYGKAERMLAGAHPHRFNRLGQARWRGFIYGGAAILPSLLRPVVYHGYHGAAPFQPVAHRRAEAASMWAGACVPLAAPLAVAGLVLGLVASAWWFLLAAAAVLGIATYGCSVAVATELPRGEARPRALRAMVALLHVLQPFARTWGRVRARGVAHAAPPERRWTGDRWQWLEDLETELQAAGCRVSAAEPSDRSDLVVRRGPLARASVTTAVMWNWSPQASIRVRPGWLSWCSLGVAVAAPLAAGAWALAGSALIVAVVAYAMVMLRRRVALAIEHTTRGSTS